MFSIETLRGTVRPIVTIGLTGVFCAACFTDSTAAERLEPLALLVIGFWFNERAMKNGNHNNSGDKP